MSDNTPYDNLPIGDDGDDAELVLDPSVMAELESMLGDPSMWEETSPLDEGAIIAAISAEARERQMFDVSTLDTPSTHEASITTVNDGAPVTASVSDQAIDHATTGATLAAPEASNVVPISAAKRWFGPIAAGVAAALVVLVGAAAITGGSDGDTGPSGVEVALAGTELTPEASAVADVTTTPNGTRIVVQFEDLPPAPEGSYYEAWLIQGDSLVSAGTFHLRGGGAKPIELWAGVTIDDFPGFAVTIQDEGQDAASDQIVLMGMLPR